MIDFTPRYISSQILTILIYFGICITFFLRNRKSILKINVYCDIIQILAFIMLNGITGAVMVSIIAIRDTYLLINEKNDVINKNKDKDIFIFIGFLIVEVILSIPSYDGILSLFSVIATIISTFALWQKRPKMYKFLEIFSSLSWLVYHIFLMSIMAILLESILLISAIIRLILDFKKSDI